MNSEREQVFKFFLTLDLPDQKLSRYQNHKAFSKMKILNGFINTVNSHEASGAELQCTLESKERLSGEQRNSESWLQKCCCTSAIFGVEIGQDIAVFTRWKCGSLSPLVVESRAFLCTPISELLHVSDSNSLSSSTAFSRSYLTATEFVCRIGAGSHIFNRAVTPAVSGDRLLFQRRRTKPGSLLIYLYMQWAVP